MTKDISIKVSTDNHRWLSNQSEATQVSIKSIVDLAIKRLRGEPETSLMVLFRDKKGRNGSSKSK